MLSVSRVLLTLLTIASLLGISYKIPVPREDILTKTIQLLFSQEQHSGIGVGVFNVNSSFSRDLHSEVFAHHSATVNFIFYNPFNHLRDFDSVGTKELDFILIFLSHDHLVRIQLFRTTSSLKHKLILFLSVARPVFCVSPFR